MTRKQENIIILGIFTLLLVLVLGFNLFSVPENIRPAGSAPAITMPAPAPASQEAAKSPGTQPLNLSSRQEAGAGGWGAETVAVPAVAAEQAAINRARRSAHIIRYRDFVFMFSPTIEYPRLFFVHSTTYIFHEKSPRRIWRLGDFMARSTGLFS